MPRLSALRRILPIAFCALAAVGAAWTFDSYVAWSHPSADSVSKTANSLPEAAISDSVQHTVPTVFLDTRRLAHFSVPVSNKTGSTQHFAKVVPSCGCTSAELAKPELGPGETTTLEVDFDAFHKFGKQRLIIRLRTDSGDELVHELHTVVYKRGMFETPGLFHVGAVEPGHSGQYRLAFKLYALRLEQLPEAAHFRCDSECLTCEQGTATIEHLDGIVSKSIPLTVSLRAPAEPGSHQCILAAEFQSAGEANRVEQTVAWSVKEPYSVRPSQLFLGAISDETTQPIVRIVDVSRTDHQPIKVLSCAAPSKHIRLDIEDGPGQAARIRVTVDPKGITGDLWCRVDVVTDHPTQPSTNFAVAATRRVGK